MIGRGGRAAAPGRLRRAPADRGAAGHQGVPGPARQGGQGLAARPQTAAQARLLGPRPPHRARQVREHPADARAGARPVAVDADGGQEPVAARAVRSSSIIDRAHLVRGVHQPTEGQPDRGLVAVRRRRGPAWRSRTGPRRPSAPPSVSGRPPNTRQYSTSASAWSSFMCSMIPAACGRSGSGSAAGVLLGAHPAHPAEAAHVAHRGRRPAGRAGSRRTRRRTRPGARPGRPSSTASRSPAGTSATVPITVTRASASGSPAPGLGGHQRRPRVRGQVAAVLGQVAQQQQRPTGGVHGVADQRPEREAALAQGGQRGRAHARRSACGSVRRRTARRGCPGWRPACARSRPSTPRARGGCRPAPVVRPTGPPGSLSVVGLTSPAAPARVKRPRRRVRRRLGRWPSTATPAWCCGCRSSARRTGSSPCSPGGTARCARWPRGCAAPGPAGGPGWSRSTTSTCSATPAARWTSSPRRRPSTRSAPGSSATTPATPRAARCWRPPTGWSPRRASRRCGCTCCWSGRSGRWPAGNGTRRWCWTRSCCGPWPTPAGRPRSPTAPGAPSRGRTRRSTSRPAERSARAAARPARSPRPAETFALLDALLHGDWASADGAATATRRDTSGLVAAHLQWHLERQLRSLPLVERRPSGAARP